MGNDHTKIQNHLKITSKLLASIVFGLGLFVLVGWLFDVAFLKSVLPDFVSMKPNTAVCFILSGIALWLLNSKESSFFSKSIIFFCSSVVLLVGVLTLFEYFFKSNFHMDEWLFKDTLPIGTLHAGRMSPITAFNFCLSALIFFMLNRKSPKYNILHVLILLLFTLSLLGFSGYLYGEKFFYGVSLYTQMAIHASLLFILLSIGMLFTQGRKGIMVVFMSHTLGGAIARRLIPPVIIFPLLLGWLRLQGENLGWYTISYGVALFSAVIIPILIVFVLWNAQRIMRIENSHKKTEEIVKQKSEELMQSNKELEQFIYVASHDLQEPLRTIFNFVGLLEEKYSGKFDNEGNQYFAFIVAATVRMQSLIADLLNFSRLGKSEECAAVNVNELLKEIMKDMKSAITASRATLTFGRLPILKADKSKLKLLFQQLISNALKFHKTDVAPEINITVEEKESEYLFAIHDNGIGIAPEYADKLFVIFRRLHNVMEYSGTGMGLATCKKIVMLYHGKIWVKSKLGEGSTFYFTFPKTDTT